MGNAFIPYFTNRLSQFYPSYAVTKKKQFF